MNHLFNYRRNYQSLNLMNNRNKTTFKLFCVLILSFFLFDISAQELNNQSLDVNCDTSSNQDQNCCSSDAICYYIAPEGSDDNIEDVTTGRSYQTALKTLEGAQMAILRDWELGIILENIEVRIKGGTYFQKEQIAWTTHWPDRVIRFMPADYKFGSWGSFSDSPVFDGKGSNNAWFWLNTRQSAGANTNLQFYYLEVKNYVRGALVFEGHPEYQKRWNGNNYLYGMSFHNLGNKYGSEGTGYAGVFLVNSRSNTIRNCHFVNLINSTEPGNIHAVYMKSWSSNNLIKENRMENISGDPIRVRHGSNDNDIRANIMKRTGSDGFFSNWYDDYEGKCGAGYCNQECPSWRNWFRYNTLHCGFDGKDIPVFYYHRKPDCVPSACVDHSPNAFLETASNTIIECSDEGP